MKTILDVVNEFRMSDPPLNPLNHNAAAADVKFSEFQLVNWNGRPRIVPSEALNLPGRPSSRSFMYRGENQRYPTSRPTLFRNAPDDEWKTKALLTLERFKVAELELALREHPFKAIADKYGFHLDYHGLAQHYGIPTSLLDLTSNVEVAAFFAVAKWDCHAKLFRPMEVGTGIMYRFDWGAFGPGYSKFFEPVGFGPGLRPARQHAWTFRPRLGVDFQRLPHVTAFEFNHSLAASVEVFQKFKNGELLYPQDCLASLVEKLRDLPFLTMHAIRHASKQDGHHPEDIESNVQKAAKFLNAELSLNILEDYELQLNEEDIITARQQAAGVVESFSEMGYSLWLIREPKAK